MDDEQNTRPREPDVPVPSVEQIAGLDRFLDRLVADRRPAPDPTPDQEGRERMLAAQLRLARDGVEEPDPAFLQSLEREVGRVAAQQRRRSRAEGVTRGRFLRTAATLASGVGLGAAATEGAAVLREGDRPRELVAAGNGRWYQIAAVGEVPEGGSKAFTAGGVLGYLLNTSGQLHAVSAVCTHMGCLVKPSDPTDAEDGLRCLCHGSRFSRRGAVVAGRAPSPLQTIQLRVEQGQVYALGTREGV